MGSVAEHQDILDSDVLKVSSGNINIGDDQTEEASSFDPNETTGMGSTSVDDNRENSVRDESEVIDSDKGEESGEEVVLAPSYDQEVRERVLSDEYFSYDEPEPGEDDTFQATDEFEPEKTNEVEDDEPETLQEEEEPEILQDEEENEPETLQEEEEPDIVQDEDDEPETLQEEEEPEILQDEEENEPETLQEEEEPDIVQVEEENERLEENEQEGIHYENDEHEEEEQSGMSEAKEVKEIPKSPAKVTFSPSISAGTNTREKDLYVRGGAKRNTPKRMAASPTRIKEISLEDRAKRATPTKAQIRLYENRKPSTFVRAPPAKKKPIIDFDEASLNTRAKRAIPNRAHLRLYADGQRRLQERNSFVDDEIDEKSLNTRAVMARASSPNRAHLRLYNQRFHSAPSKIS